MPLVGAQIMANENLAHHYAYRLAGALDHLHAGFSKMDGRKGEENKFWPKFSTSTVWIGAESGEPIVSNHPHIPQ